MEMQFAAKGVSCTICNRYLPVECVETQCNSICDSQTRTFWQQDRLSKTEEQLICVIHTHTQRHQVVLTYVCRSNAPGKKVLSAFAVLLAAAATAAQQSLSANTQQQALTGTRATTPSPNPPFISFANHNSGCDLYAAQSAKGKAKKQKQKKTLTISCSSKIKCKCNSWHQS